MRQDGAAATCSDPRSDEVRRFQSYLAQELHYFTVEWYTHPKLFVLNNRIINEETMQLTIVAINNSGSKQSLSKKIYMFSLFQLCIHFFFEFSVPTSQRDLNPHHGRHSQAKIPSSLIAFPRCFLRYFAYFFWGLICSF